jgi:Zn-dependent peptidase ImmA (M78 family)
LNTFSEENKQRIRSLAWKLRVKHDAVEWGVSPIDLIEVRGLYYREYNLNDKNFIKKITINIREIAKKIKSALIPQEKAVLIDLNLHSAKKPFGQGHELGHYEIPEHKEILYVCSEADLNPQTRAEMEFEANVFSSEILFPTPLVAKIHENYPISMETILLLHNYSNASIHSSAIRYVTSCDKECCLLTLDIEEDKEGKKGLRLKSQILSDPWFSKFKRRIISDDQFFPAEHNLSLVAFSGGIEEVVKNTVRLRNSDITFQAHTFYNGYKVFALLF